MAFVVANAAAVQSTDGFKNLAAKYPALMLDVFAALVSPSKKQRSV